jgi:hypothetical protein
MFPSNRFALRSFPAISGAGERINETRVFTREIIIQILGKYFIVAAPSFQTHGRMFFLPIPTVSSFGS